MVNDEYVFEILRELLETSLETKSILNVKISEPNKIDMYFIPNSEYTGYDGEDEQGYSDFEV